MLGFKDFRCASIILSGIEVTNIIRKGQMKPENGNHPPTVDQFYSMSIEIAVIISDPLVKMPYRNMTRNSRPVPSCRSDKT